MKLADNGPAKDPGRIVRTFIHHPIPIHSVAIVAGIVSYLSNDWISWVTALAIMAPIWGSGSFMIERHYKGLCKTCVAKMPDRGSEEADRHRRMLRMMHLFIARHRLFSLGPLCILAVAFPLTLILRMQGLMLFYILPSLGINGVAIYLLINHGRLQPWCPWCRSGGGNNEAEKVPDPEPVMVKTL